MGIRAVIGVPADPGPQIHMDGPGHPRLHLFIEPVIVHGQMTSRLGQDIILIRDYGRIDPAVSQILVINILEPLQGMIQGLFVQGVLLLDQVAGFQVQSVVVPRLQHVQVEPGFEPAGRNPAGETDPGCIFQKPS